jgi:hypothetical protein
MIGYKEFSSDIQAEFSYLIDNLGMRQCILSEDEKNWLCGYENNKIEILFSIEHPWNALDMQIILKSKKRNINSILDKYFSVSDEFFLNLSKRILSNQDHADLRTKIKESSLFYKAILDEKYVSILMPDFDWDNFSSFIDKC